jgi:hypothetical protein
MFDIPYKKPMKKPYNSLASVFNSTMMRELEVITEYWTEKELRVFFRRNKNTNAEGANARIYYYADEGIREGSLLKINGKVYLAINQARIENSLYKISDLFECNIIIDTFCDGYLVTVPGYAYSTTSNYGINSSVVSVISGNLEVITENSELSSKIEVGSRVDALNDNWEIKNITVVNGLTHIYMEKEVNAGTAEFLFSIAPRDKYEVGKIEAIEVSVKRRANDNSSWEDVINPALIWESSDISIVSFDDEGMAHFIKSGTAAITATWIERNLTSTIDIEIIDEGIPVCDILYTGAAEIRSGGSAKKFTASFGVLEETIPNIIPIWEIEILDSRIDGKITYTVDNANKTISVTAASGSYIGATFNLWLTTNAYTLSTGEQIKVKVTITVKGLF